MLFTRTRGAAARLFPLLCLLAGSAFSQITGDLDVKVADKSDAVIAGAQLTVTNTETGAIRKGATDSLGSVRFTLLNIGTYQVKVENNGFETVVTRAEVNTGAVKEVRLTLNVRSVATEVVVEESAVAINTVSAQLQTTTSAKAVVELPLSSSGVLGLAGTTPGVVPVTSRNPFLGLGSYNSNGGRGRGNNITIDSATATDVSTTGGAGLGTIPEYLIREVSVISNNFSAEFGRNANSQFQILTKSGTNEIHGQAWEQFKNEKLNARDFFATARPPLRDNRFGGYLSAPAIQNKLFVIGHYERQFIRGAGGTRTATTWSAAEVATLNPTSKQLFDQLKGGQYTSATGTVANAAPLGTDNTNGSIRMDWNIDDKSTLFGRWAIQDIASQSPGLTFITSNLPTNGASSVNRPQNATLNYTRAISPALVWNFIAAFGRSRPIFNPLESFGGPYVSFLDGRAGLGIWTGGPQGRVQNTYQYLNTMAWAKGKHLIKGGYEVNRVQANSFFDSNVRGTWTFANFAAFVAGAPVTYSQRFGNSVRGNRVWNNYAFVQDDFRVTRNLTLNLGMRLEVNDGVTEVNGLISNQNLNGTGALGAAGTGALGSIDVGQKVINRLYNWAPRFGFAYNPGGSGKMAIRGGYGWAYDYIFLNPITNIRFAPPFMYNLNTATFSGSDTYANLVAGSADFQRVGRATVGTFGTTLRNFGGYTAIDQNLKNPRVQQWNLTIEREFAGMLWRGGYVGTKSDYLQRTRPLNFLRPELRVRASSAAEEAALAPSLTPINANLNAGPTSVLGNRIDPRFNNLSIVESSANSNYHGLQFWVQKRFAKGFAFTTSYTWGKSIDDISDALGVLEVDSSAQQNPFNNRDNRAASAFDVTHRFVVTHNWELPWFKNSGHKVLQYAAGGWALNGIWQAQTGAPILLLSGPRQGYAQFAEPLFLGGSGALRPNLVGTLNVPLQPDPGTGTRNPSLVTNSGLAQPFLGNFGTLGRNVLRQNGLMQYDITLQKEFSLTEKLKSQLQMQAFNLFNQIYFRAPGQSLFAPATFGYYQDTSNNTRNITLVLRFMF